MAVSTAAVAACATDPTPIPQPSLETATPVPTTTSVPSPLPTTTPTPTLSPSPTVSPTGERNPSEPPTFTFEPTPTLTPLPTPSPTPVAPDGTFPDAPDRDLYELARSLLLKTDDPIPRVVNPQPVSLPQGRVDTFWVTDLQELRVYTTEATLRLVTPHAYWYVEDGARVSQGDIESASRAFEEEIYPRVTSVFGTEWTPGVDNDPHLTILHARLDPGTGGYFSPVDEYPLSVHEHSNQREIVYITSAMKVGSSGYLAVLAHELQHAVHWNGDDSEETWVNEGLSEVAASVAGYRPSSQDVFLRSPVISLVNWPNHVSPHYGASFLFMDYLTSHYGTREDLRLLVEEPEDGIRGIDAYLANLGYDATFEDVFGDWSVANYLDQPGGGPYSYPDNDVSVRVRARIGDLGERESTIPQYSAEYTAIDIFEGDIVLRFDGQVENSLLPLALDGGSCWWSNRGDSISSTLTREMDLSGVDKATLRFRVWHDLEDEWDYAYVEVSTDRGSTWDILAAPGTSPASPLANSFGPGYTGTSDGWQEVEVDLTGYAGREALLRFHNVTDGALNYMGICLDGVSIPEIGFFDSGLASDGWQADGFLRIDNVVPQRFVVQVIEVGDQVRVSEVELDDENHGELVISRLEGLDEVVVVVAALAPKTLQKASYTLTLERPR